MHAVPPFAARYARQLPQVVSDLLTTTALPASLTLSRAGNATLFDSTGKLTWAAANLQTYSNAFDNSSGWSNRRCLYTANTSDTTDPLGTNTAYKVAPDTNNNTHLFFSANTSGAGYSSIFSIYAKANQYSNILLSAGNDNAGVFFNLSDGTVGNASANFTGTIQNVGNGWYRCSILFAGNIQPQVEIKSAPNTNGIYAGNGTDCLYLWGAQLERVTYQTTPSTYVATTSAAYYGPRFDYDPSTLAARGLLVEATATNVATYSNDMSTGYTLLNASKATGQSDPAGQTNAIKLTPSNTTSAQHTIYQNSIGTNGSVTISAFVKASGNNYIQLSDGQTFGVNFDIGNGAWGSAFGAAVTTLTPQNIGGGWYRIAITYTRSNASSGVAFYLVASASGSSTYAPANTTDGVLIFGVQVENTANWTSYIPTTSASVARAAESLTAASYSTQPTVIQYRPTPDGTRARKIISPYSGISSETGEWLEKIAIYAPSTPTALLNQFLNVDGQL